MGDKSKGGRPGSRSNNATTLGLVEQLDDVLHRQPQSALGDAGAELQHAADVGSGEDVGLDGGDVVHFGVEDLHRELVLRDVVDAGGAAAVVAVGHLDEFEA